MTTRTRWGRWLALVLAIVFVAAACSGGGREDTSSDSGDSSSDTSGGGEDSGPLTIDTASCTGSPTQGVTDTSIKFGTSVPQSGLFAAFSKIAEGYNA